jgi:hypothetical protein
MFDGIKEMARAAGRSPAELELIIAAGVDLHKTPIQKDRVDFTGTREQIAGDFATARKLDAAEIVIYAQFLAEGESAQNLVARMEDLWKIAKQA